ncbi:MAG: YcxB family protein [Oscillospiraceae bacterium]|nr:YcxB family protein [Oscillospiraceae bacterium]
MNKSGKPLLSRSYHIPLSMFDDAFRRFQKKFVYPQNIFISVIFLAIAGVYVHAAIKDNTQTLAYLLIAACLALVLVRWYRTFKLRRAVHDALKDVEQDTYELNVYEDGMVIRTKDAPQPEASAEPEPDAEPAAQEEKTGNGFQQLFPEEPAQRDPVPPTELPFGTGMKLLEFPEYFMAYVVKQNFYVIPKKDFSDDEIAQLKQLFHL